MSEPQEHGRSLSRRDLLRGRLLDAWLGSAPGAAPDGLDPNPVGPTAPVRHRRAFPVLRPPGAVEESRFLAGCTRCNACVEACPEHAIVHAPARLRAAAGTPVIDPFRAPCVMCPDFPCIAVCEPGVLLPELPKVMGRARIQTFACLAFTGSFCSVCSEQCPVEGAIEVSGGKPRVVEQLCTGCGVCQHVCPAPENAVLLMPLESRPPAPARP